MKFYSKSCEKWAAISEKIQTGGMGVEDVEFLVVLKFPVVLKKKECHTILQNFSKWTLVFSVISKSK